MPDPASLLLFTGTALALLLTPGPAVFYIVTRAADQGTKAGVVSSLGLTAGGLVHVAAAVAGLSALLLSWSLGLNMIKYLGAAYLVYLGVQRLRGDDLMPAAVAQEGSTMRRVFWQGVLVNVLNPKAAIFFLAFLPQFVAPARGNVPGQLLFLGLLFLALGLVTDLLYAMLAGQARHWLRRGTRGLNASRYASGAVYIGLGLAAALAPVRRS